MKPVPKVDWYSIGKYVVFCLLLFIPIYSENWPLLAFAVGYVIYVEVSDLRRS